MVQNKYKGAVIHAFLHFFPTKVPYQRDIISQIIEGNIHSTLYNKHNKCHKIFIIAQGKKTWSANSPTLQRLHWSAKIHPLLFNKSKVKILPQTTSQIKNPTFVSTHEFQTKFIEKVPSLSSSKQE